MNKRDREWNRWLVIFYPDGRAVAGQSPGDYSKPARLRSGAVTLSVAAATENEAIDAASRKLKENNYAA